MVVLVINSVIVSTLFTLLIVMGVIVIFFGHRYFIDLRKDNIKTRTIAIIYILEFILLALAISTIIWLWGYDVTDYLSGMAQSAGVIFENNVPRIIGTLVVLFASMMIYKILKIALHKVGSRTSANQRRKKTISKVTLSIVKYLVVIVGFLAMLATWGINVLPALAGLGIMGIVIGLGAQKFINDLISGFFIIFEHHYDVGDWVEISGFMGEVTDIGLKTTKVKNFKGEIKIFNNGSISPVSNFSKTDSLAIIDFGIAYKEDIAKTITVLEQALPSMREQQPNMLENPRVLGVVDLANSSVNLRIVCKVISMTQWGVERALRQRVKEVLVQHGIEIPFPQLVLHKTNDSK